MIDWTKFMDVYWCYRDQQCKDDVMNNPVHFLRPMRYFMFDPTWSMVQEFLQNNSTKYYYEKLMIFEDWEDYNPILTPERVPVEHTKPEFFVIPKERRGDRFNLTHEFENLSEVNHKKIRISVGDHSDYMKTLTIPIIEPGISHGWHISIRRMDDPETPIGHNKYDYFLAEKELLWLRHDESWSSASHRGSTVMGLPHCISDTFNWLQLDEYWWARCPGKDKNEQAQSGMTKEFLEKLGVTDP
jgi:hypothetical protein